MMNQSVLTPEQRAAYDRDGFVMVRGLFDSEEAVLLQKAMETDPQGRGNLYNRNDAQGLATKIVLWNHPGDSRYGLAARSHRIAGTMRSLPRRGSVTYPPHLSPNNPPATPPPT